MITFQDLHLLSYIQPFIILAVYLNKTICKILGYRLFPSSDMLACLVDLEEDCMHCRTALFDPLISLTVLHA